MKTVLHLTPYSVVTPKYGGAIRVNNLCRELSQQYRVVQFAQQVAKHQITWSLSPMVEEITPTYTEYSSRHPLSLLLYGIACSYLKCPPFLQGKLLDWVAPVWLHQQLQQAAVINVEHPWQFSWVYQQRQRQRHPKPIVVTAHNIEAELCSPEDIAAPAAIARYLVQQVERHEGFALRHADCIFTMSEEDTATLSDRYGIDPERCVVIPNGVDCNAFTPATPALRQQRKQELGLTDRSVILFAGSTHLPNQEAVQQIVKWAENWPDPRSHFLIV
ncbi:MAG: glycosyltransferase, partial [Leptolyngbyaceae bacterium]|nr:glycosyltransferase [Leptolyngbyaceae bacterium]